MGVTYLKKKGSKRKACHCNKCGERILWAVEKNGRYFNNVPINYNEDIEKFHYDEIDIQVYFDKKTMVKHWETCIHRNKI